MFPGGPARCLPATFAFLARNASCTYHQARAPSSGDMPYLTVAFHIPASFWSSCEHGSKAGFSSGWLRSTPGGQRAQIRGLRAGARWLLPPRPQPQLLSPARAATLNHAQVLPPLRRQPLGRTRIESAVPRGSSRRRTRPAIPRRGSPTAWRSARRAASRPSPRPLKSWASPGQIPPCPSARSVAPGRAVGARMNEQTAATTRRARRLRSRGGLRSGGGLRAG